MSVFQSLISDLWQLNLSFTSMLALLATILKSDHISGNLFSSHANLIEQEMQRSEEKTVIHQSLLKCGENTEVKTKFPVQPAESNDQIQKNTFSEDLANEMFLEAQELMNKSHWLTNITETDIDNDNFLSASTSSKCINKK